jgi:hypothetical protein
MDQKTDFLVPASSFLIGVGSLLNFSGNYFEYNNSRTTAQADQRALSNDWAMVGQDIRQAMKQVEKDVGQGNPNVHGKE